MNGASGKAGSCCASWERALWLMAGLWLVVAIASTWVFAWSYVPTPEDAYSSIVHAEGAFGASDSRLSLYPRVVKWCAEQALVVTGLLLVAVMWWSRSWDSAVGGACARWRWWLALAVPGLAMGWSFFGQLLPMDQHAWHGTVVRAGIIESTTVLGPWMRELILGGREITGATLTGFHGLHVGLFPALMLLLAVAILKPFLKEPGKCRGLDVWLAFSVPVQLVVLTAVAGSAAIELGLAARSHLPHPDVRPEWFFMPLSKALAVVGPGFLGTLVVLAPGGIATLLVLWPWIAKRLKWNLQVAILCGLGAGFCGLLAWEVAEDKANEAGWFAKPDLESLMTEMGKLNETLGYPGSHDPRSAFAASAELQVMARLTNSLDGHKDVKDAAKWRQWSRDTAAAAEAIWASGGDPAQVGKAISDMRAACRSCHELHKEDVDLYQKAPKPEQAATESNEPKAATPSNGGDTVSDPKPPTATDPEPELPARTYFHPSDFEGLRPTIDTSVKLGALMKRMLEQFDVLNGPNKSAYPMAILNIEGANQATAGQHADFADLIEAAEWAGMISEAESLMAALRASESESKYRENLSKVRQNCVKCHDAIGVEDAKIKPVVR